MATLSKWAIFVRAFIVALLATAPARTPGQSSSEDAVWAEAQASGSVEAYHTYLTLFPDGEHVVDAINSLRDLGAFGTVTPSRSLSDSLEGDLY